MVVRSKIITNESHPYSFLKLKKKIHIYIYILCFIVLLSTPSFKNKKS